MKKLLNRPFFIRLLHWEYWPFHVVYGPLYFYWLWLCLKARSFFFFNTSNPSIQNGGFLLESKWSIYKLLKQAYYPSTLYFRKHSRPLEVIQLLRRNSFQFPLIGKPDIGMKGHAVKKLDNEEELIEYINHSKVNFLIQEFIPYEKEAGIFYYRFPGEKNGHISGIVEKEFLKVKGDGISTIADLLKKDKRYILQLSILKKTYGKKLDAVLPENEEKILVPYGNHVRGAKFVDTSYMIDEELTQTIDSICGNIKGFYYGRLDIRYNTWEEFKRGEKFSIIEINGAGSEPTHIYDPAHSIFFAWKEITRHWNILYKISKINHRLSRQPYMSTKAGINMLLENQKYVKFISGNDERKRA